MHWGYQSGFPQHKVATTTAHHHLLCVYLSLQDSVLPRDICSQEPCHRTVPKNLHSAPWTDLKEKPSSNQYDPPQHFRDLNHRFRLWNCGYRTRLPAKGLLTCCLSVECGCTSQLPVMSPSTHKALSTVKTVKDTDTLLTKKPIKGEWC